MRVCKLAATIAFTCSLMVRAQPPAISPHGIVNAASFLAPGLPAGSIAEGSIFTIYGARLGPATGVHTGLPVAISLGGVSITLAQGATTVNVLPLFVRQDQINAIMPSNAPLGWGSLRVTYNQSQSNPSPVFIVHDGPGIFTSTGTGMGAAALQNIGSNGSLTANSNHAAAAPGQSAQLYLTGLGPITAPDNEAPPPNAPTTPVEVWVGGVPAKLLYSGRSPCCAGLDQVDFTVPSNAPEGCWVPVQIRTSKTNLSNGVSMAIAAKGGSCSDPENPLAKSIVNGGAIATLALSRTTVHQDVGVNNPIDITGDTLDYSAQKQPGGPFVSPPFLASPPPGTCTVYAGVGDFWTTHTVPDSTAASILDAGTQFTVNGSGASRTLTLAAGTAPLGSYLPLWSLPNTLFLSPGSYMVSGTGGNDVGPVTATISVPNPLTWTNRDQTTDVDRTQPLTLTWSGGPSGQTVTIVGENSDLPTNSSALFYCVAPAGASSLIVPPQVLGFLPPTQANPLKSTSIIFLISTKSAPLSARGLSTGIASALYLTGKTVVFQ